MNIVIRTDSSYEIGTGHVMRSVTLGKQLREKGINVYFICRELSGSSLTFIGREGFQVHRINSPSVKNVNLNWIRDNWKHDSKETRSIIRGLKVQVDLLIVDHYGLDEKWENELKCSVGNIMVIDDLANRKHQCDVLLDQNYYHDIYERYKGLVPSTCNQLLGPNYIILRDEFLDIDHNKNKRDGIVRNVLVFFGGTDPTGETIKTLKAIQELENDSINFTIVVGKNNKKRNVIKKMCDEIKNVMYLCQVDNMAELMVRADLSIGAGGTTSWERCFLGLPSITIIIADNQKELSKALEDRKAICCLGNSNEVSSTDIKERIKELLDNPIKINEMTTNCRRILSPEVAKDRILLKKILELLNVVHT